MHSQAQWKIAEHELRMMRAETATLLCGDNVVQCAGQTFVPDRHTAFVDCSLAHAFPVDVGDYKAFHPAVLANSWRSMLYKVFDIGHMVRAYDPKENPRDRIVGTVVAVEYNGATKVTGTREEAPGLRAVAAMARKAEGVEQVISQHVSGRMPWTVSLEVDYKPLDSGFVVSSDCGEESEFTPEDLKAAGYEYWPLLKAPDGLFETFDTETKELVGKWNGVQPLLLMGGLDGKVEFKGIGLTPLGKEPEAYIASMTAQSDLTKALRMTMAAVVNCGFAKKS